MIKAPIALSFDFESMDLSQAVSLFPTLAKRGGYYLPIAKQLYDRVIANGIALDQVHLFGGDQVKKLAAPQINSLVTFVNKYMKDHDTAWRIRFAEEQKVFGLYHLSIIGKAESPQKKPANGVPSRRYSEKPMALMTIEHYTSIALRVFGMTISELKTKIGNGNVGEVSPLAHARRAFVYVGREVVGLRPTTVNEAIDLRSSSGTCLYITAVESKDTNPKIKPLINEVKKESSKK